MTRFDRIASALGNARMKRSVVKIITNEKFLQGGVSSVLVGMVTAATEGSAVVANDLLNLPFPSKWTMVLLLTVPLAFFLWADQNTDEWRDIVEEVTDEDADPSE